MNVKVSQSLQNLGKALKRLEEATQVSEHDSLKVDGTIQRFEFTFELCWKTIKRILEIEGIIVNTPRETLAHAFQINWIKNEKFWISMLEDRILTSRIYSEAEATLIFDRIHDLYVEELKSLLHLLKTKL
ncbi:MAG: HI0074 family nucleotidyltransferase substrate-binding subunit [Chlamydiales bacterium]|nr:HI0074 family nucleotidyltransferase substrate-binding subunit [Chlamydiales bacterium]